MDEDLQRLMQQKNGKEELLSLASGVWSRVGRHYDDPNEFLRQLTTAGRPGNPRRDAVIARVKERLRGHGLPDSNPDLIEQEVRHEDELFQLMISSSLEAELTFICLGAWAESAYAQIVLGHKLAAGLIVTNVTKDIADLVEMPFRGMCIELPENLLAIDAREGETVSIRRILVTKFDNKFSGYSWAYVALTGTSLSFWRFGCTTEQLLGGEMALAEGADPRSNPLAVEITDRDERVSACLGRIILNTCLTMSDPSALKKVGPGHHAYETARAAGRTQFEPLVRTFQVGRAVTHDFREAVRNYIQDGNERKLNVQTLVAGHWKRQVHGTGRALRKVIHVEPYWRGPEDAPIIQRPHVLE